MVASIAAALLLGLSAPATAALKYTGRDCTNEYFFNGSGVQVLGHRCARAKIHYGNSASGKHWVLWSYYIYYRVTPGLSYGSSNNEDPFKISSGFLAGNQTYRSPDGGNTNVWQYRNIHDTITFKRRTRVTITAIPDVPGRPDPHLHIATSKALW